MNSSFINKIIFLLVLSLYISCSDIDRQQYVPMLSFNLDSTAMNENDEIRIVYCSSGGNVNKNKDFFIQFVAIKIGSNDTINILTDHSDQISQTDGDKIFLYKRKYNKDYLDALNFLANLTKGEIESGNQNASLNIPMVITDENYNKFGKNKYPTIFGEIEMKR